MKKNNIKEYYGTPRPSFAGASAAGGNFYYGKHLTGLGGADSKFSRRTQALVPEDYYDKIDEEEIDENVVVENSIYSLKNTLNIISEVDDVIDLIPDPDGEEGDYIFDLDPRALARTEDSFENLGLDDILDVTNPRALIKTLAPRMIPGVTDIGSLYRIIKAYLALKKDANKLIDLSEELEKELEERSLGEIVAEKEKFAKIFASGIKEIEAIQARIYENIGELAQAIMEAIPTEYVTGAASGAATAGLGAAAGYAAGKAAELALAGLAGEAIEKVVKTFVEGQENHGQDFETWLTRNKDPNTRGLKVMLFFLEMISSFPGSGFIELVNPSITIGKVFRALLEGAKMQNILIQKINILKNPSVLDPKDLEQSDALEEPEKSSSSSIGNTIRRLFVSKPEDEGTGLFAESLNSKSLAYLIEEKDSVLDEDLEEEDKKEIEEFSGAGAVAIGTLPLGASTKGPKGAHSSISGGKAFPYSKKNRKEFSKYARKTFGGER